MTPIKSKLIEFFYPKTTRTLAEVEDKKEVAFWLMRPRNHVPCREWRSGGFQR